MQRPGGPAPGVIPDSRVAFAKVVVARALDAGLPQLRGAVCVWTHAYNESWRAVSLHFMAQVHLVVTVVLLISYDRTSVVVEKSSANPRVRVELAVGSTQRPALSASGCLHAASCCDRTLSFCTKSPHKQGKGVVRL